MIVRQFRNISVRECVSAPVTRLVLVQAAVLIEEAVGEVDAFLVYGSKRVGVYERTERCDDAFVVGVSFTYRKMAIFFGDGA